MHAPLAAQGLHGLQAFFAAHGLHGLQAFLAAQGLQGLHAFLAAHGLQGLQAFLAAQGLQGLHPLFGAQGLQGLHGLLAQAACRRGTKHFLDTPPPPAAHGLQGLHGLQARLAAHGLHGLQPFLAAQGLHGLQPFLAAHGLHGLQPFLAAQGLHGLQPFLAAQGLHGLQPFFAAQGLHGLQAAICMVRSFGFATGSRFGCSVPALAACTGTTGAIAPPTAIPTPTKAGMTVVDRSENLNDLTNGLLFTISCWVNIRVHAPFIRRRSSCQNGQAASNQSYSQDCEVATRAPCGGYTFEMEKILKRAFIFVLMVSLPIFADAQAHAGNIEPETVVIPAGSYITGSDRAEREAAYLLDETAYGHNRTREWRWYENEGKRQKIETGTYRITRTLITNDQYRAFVEETGHAAPTVDQETWESYKLIHPYKRTRRHAWRDSRPPGGRDDHPVVIVSHGDAEAYAEWLSKRTGKTWRLPTENEWERAARGNSGRRFPWGDAYDPKRLNSHDLGPFDTTAVGRFPDGVSPYGLLDPAGQVFEWTATQAGKGRFVVKGGSWDDKGCGICRPAARHSRPEHLKHILVGFRLVLID